MRASGGALAINVSGTGIAFCLNILLARLLGTDEYGYYIYALTWINVLSHLGKLGMEGSSLRYVPVYHARAEWSLLRGFIGQSQKIVLVTSLVLASSLLAIVLIMWTRLSHGLAFTLIIACFLLPVNIFQQIRSSYIRALKNVVLALSPQAIVRPVLIILGAVIYFYVVGKSMNSSAAMVINVASTTSVLVLTGVFLNRLLPSGYRTNKTIEHRNREWISVAVPLFLISGLNLLMNQFGTILTGILLSTTEAGIYAVADRLASFLSFGLIAVNSIAAPLISQLYVQGKMKELQEMLTIAARSSFGIAVPLAIVLIVFGKKILAMFGPSFTAGYASFVILSVGHLVNAFAGSVGLVMIMTKYQNEALMWLGLSAALNIILNFSLIPHLGIEGASIATAGAMIFWNLMLCCFVAKRMGLRTTALH